jgi:SH3 domain protein
LILISAPSQAAHITDKLLAGLYDKPGAAQPIKLLPSGTPLEVLEKKGDHAKVRLGDGVIGWVEQRYVTDEKPARALLLELQAESARLREEAKGSADNGDGAAKELAGLREQLAAAQGEIERLRQTATASPGPAGPAPDQEVLRQENQLLRERLAKVGEIASLPPPEARIAPRPPLAPWHLGALALFLLAGFVGGVLFRNYRIRQRYSGLRF